MRWLLLVALVSCQEYQPEPFIEIRHRQETLGVTPYEGEQLIVGMRYVFKPRKSVHASPLVMPAPTAPIIIDHQDPTDDGLADKAFDAAQGINWTWPAVFGVLSIAVLVLVLRHRFSPKTGTNPTQS